MLQYIITETIQIFVRSNVNKVKAKIKIKTKHKRNLLICTVWLKRLKN